MKLSAKQQADLDTVLYFIPMNVSGWKEAITDSDVEAYFAWSDKGDDHFLKMSNYTYGSSSGDNTMGATALKWGKTYRDNAMTEWRRDLKEGLLNVWDLAHDDPDLPKSVIKQLGIEKPFAYWLEVFDRPDKFGTPKDKSPVERVRASLTTRILEGYR